MHLLRFRVYQRKSDIFEVYVGSDIETVEKAGEAGKRLPLAWVGETDMS